MTFRNEKKTTNKEDERLREYVLVNICSMISTKEINKIIKEAKNEFRRKTRVNKIVIGNTDKVIKDTDTILRKVLLQNQYEVMLEKTQDDAPKSSSKTQNMPSQGEQVKVDIPSIPEVQAIGEQVEVDATPYSRRG